MKLKSNIRPLFTFGGGSFFLILGWLNAYLYMYTCVRVYTEYVYAYEYMYECMYLCVYMCTYVRVCVSLYIYMCAYVFKERKKERSEGKVSDVFRCKF